MGSSTWQMFPDSSVVFNQGEDEFTVVGSDLSSPAYDFLSSLSDLGMTWDIVNGVVQITGTANPNEMIPVAQTPKQVPDVTPTSSSLGLVGVLKDGQKSNNDYINQQNVILDNHSKLLKESNDINRVIAEQLIKANDINVSSATAIATSFDRLIELKRVQNATNLYNGYIQEDMANALNKTSNSTQEISNSTKEISNSTKALSDSQVKTNLNIDEHYTFEKTSSITDTDGNKFSPREIKAKANAEIHLEKKDSNSFDWKDFFVNTLGDGSGGFDDDEPSIIDSISKLLNTLKVTPFENIDSIDNSRVIVKKEGAL